MLIYRIWEHSLKFNGGVMTKYIILLSAVMAFACNYECEERKIAALERIATALEKLNNNNVSHPNIVVNSYSKIVSKI